MHTNSTTEGGFVRRAEEFILTALTHSPLTEPTLKSQVRQSVQGFSAQDYKTLLAKLVAARKIYGRPKVGKNGKLTRSVDSYVLGEPPPPPRELAPAAIATALAAGPLSPDVLKGKLLEALPGLAPKDYTQVLAALQAERRIHAQPKLGKNGKPTTKPAAYALGEAPPPDPRPFIQPLLKSWDKVSKEAEKAGVSRAALVAALLTALGVSAERGIRPATPAEARAEVQLALRDLIARDGAGALIPIRQLRAATGLFKGEFDRALLELRETDTIILHHHDYVGSLSEKERQELVADAYGNYYVGVALRGDS